MGRVKGGNAEEFWIRYEKIRPSQKDLPLIIRTGIKQSTLSTYKTKQRYPRADEAVKIAQALGTTVEYLVLGEEAKTAAPQLGMTGIRADILKDLNDIDDVILEPIMFMIRSVAENCKKKNVSRERTAG